MSFFNEILLQLTLAGPQKQSLLPLFYYYEDIEYKQFSATSVTGISAVNGTINPNDQLLFLNQSSSTKDF
jgi:hypothetical protein